MDSIIWKSAASFEDVVQALQEAQVYGKRIYLLGTCRQSWWHHIDALGLTQWALEDAALDGVVHGILGAELVEFAKECGQVPVFAAFVRFLADKQNHVALEELRNSKDFRSWLVNHILQAGGMPKGLLPLDQARLMMALPGSHAVLMQLESGIAGFARVAHGLGGRWLAVF